MMTKDQERETLKKIAKLIASAGPDSYIGMAFKGCTQMALENIENDWGCSMADRAEEAEHRLDLIEKELGIRAKYEQELLRKIDDLRAAEQKAREAQIPPNLYKRLWLAIDQQHTEAMTAMDRSAELLAEMADAPGDIAVAQALKNLAKQKTRRDETARLLVDLEKYEPANL